MAGCSRVPPGPGRCVRLFCSEVLHGDAFTPFVRKQSRRSAKAPRESQRSTEDPEPGAHPTEQPGGSGAEGPLTTVKRRALSGSEESGLKYRSLYSPRPGLLAAFGLRRRCALS